MLKKWDLITDIFLIAAISDMDTKHIKDMNGGMKMSNVFTKKWFYAALVRSLKTVAQTAVATIGTAAVMGDVNWVMVASASALAGVLSLLTSIAGLPEVTANENQ